MSPKRGALIIIEGLDRIGKTTQSKLLLDYLTNERRLRCERLSFPDRSTHIGSLIDNYLQRKMDFNDQTIHLLFSANRWECIDTMRTKLIDGCTLIVDRYAYSGVAFTQAKGFDKAWCQSCDTGILKPDLVLYFRRNKESNCLSHTGDERYETKSFQAKVEDCFEQLRASSSKTEVWKTIDIIDANSLEMRDAASIHKEICSYVNDCIDGIKSNELTGLWKD